MDVLKKLQDRYSAELVGGELIAVIDGKHEKLGVMSAGVFTPNTRAFEMANVSNLDHDADGERGGSRRGRKPREATPEPEVTETTLELNDGTVVDEQVG